MKRVLIGLAAVTVAAVAFFVLSTAKHVPTVRAASCSASTLDATYGGYGWGSISGTANNSVGLYTFNGSGGYTFSTWGSDGGTVTSGSSSGDYVVNSTCEGDLYDPTTGTVYARFVIVSSGAEVDTVSQQSGDNISGVFKELF